MIRLQVSIREMVKEAHDTFVGLAAQGMTMTRVTHEICLAREVADRGVVMDTGTIVVENASPDTFPP
ncbi:hypothetical protein [Mesorhizobium sp.]|uniref:hypothetical protein n=1 Tax=Mesorhizobium sp. TaxID=1871066 RepID=UPI00257C6D15|nr:hypothetical protein [Mesorhizobium sp.]